MYIALDKAKVEDRTANMQPQTKVVRLKACKITIALEVALK